jgi:hypothetical protein
MSNTRNCRARCAAFGRQVRSQLSNLCSALADKFPAEKFKRMLDNTIQSMIASLSTRLDAMVAENLSDDAGPYWNDRPHERSDVREFSSKELQAVRRKRPPDSLYPTSHSRVTTKARPPECTIERGELRSERIGNVR